MLNVKGRGLAAVAVLLGMCTQASAGDERIIYASLGETTRAPIGWVEFCADNAAQCQGGPTQPRDIVMSQTAWRDLVKVNRWVNETVKPLTDQEHWGVIEKWSLPTDGYGDCEDYQLLKRKLLRERGLPQRAMRMTVVIDELNEGHAVLMIRTDRGDYILDNKTNAVLPWDETGYIYVKREGHDSMAWTSLGGVTSPTATANR